MSKFIPMFVSREGPVWAVTLDGAGFWVGAEPAQAQIWWYKGFRLRHYPEQLSLFFESQGW